MVATLRQRRNRTDAGNKQQEPHEQPNSRNVFGDVSNKGKNDAIAKKRSKDLAVDSSTLPTTTAGSLEVPHPSGKLGSKTTKKPHSKLQQPVSEGEIGMCGDNEAFPDGRITRSRANQRLKSSDVTTSLPKEVLGNKSTKRQLEQASPERGTNKRARRSARTLDNTLADGKRSCSIKRPAKTRKAKPSNDDFLKNTDYGLVRVPFDASKYTAGVSAYDMRNKSNSMEIPEYATDLFQRLYNAEPSSQPKPYMTNQRHINPRMRAILIDWLVEVHNKFRLVPDTLYLCVNLVDRYCCVANIERSQLQLVGVTALLLACKYEEIYPPEVRDCVYMTDRSYTRQEVLDMEQDIVKKLQFRLTVPTSYPFLTRFLLITNAPETIKYASNYYMERTLQEYDFLKYRPSLVAAASVCLALNNPDARKLDCVKGKRPGVPKVLLDYTGFRVQDILDVATLMVGKVCEDVVTSTRELISVKRKYESRKFRRVAVDLCDPEVGHIMSL